MASQQELLEAGWKLRDQLYRLLSNGKYTVMMPTFFTAHLDLSSSIDKFQMDPAEGDESAHYSDPLAKTQTAIELRAQMRPESQSSQNRYVAAVQLADAEIQSVTKHSQGE